MYKMQKERQKPDHEWNIITHSRKWQELELQIWKVTSGVLHRGPRRGSRHACGDVHVLAWASGSRIPPEGLCHSPWRRTSSAAPLLLAVEQGGRSKRPRKRWATGAPPPSPFIAEEDQPAPPTITGNDGFPCMSQGLVKSGSCRGSMGKRRRPRPINRHASTKAAGFWGPRRSVLDLRLRLEAKPERTLGPGATVGVLGTGVPRLACLRPTAWLS